MIPGAATATDDDCGDDDRMCIATGPPCRLLRGAPTATNLPTPVVDVVRSLPAMLYLQALCAEILANPRSKQGREVSLALASGADPLGEKFCELRCAAVRRSSGATYTPQRIARAMVDWAAQQSQPQRIVDPGTGSARFLIAAAAAFPRAELVGIELDPLAATIARTNLVCAGLAERSQIITGDYRHVTLPPIDGKTLFLGNPPYVRHHDIEAAHKRWLASAARQVGVPASGLAGLHIHFFLATAIHARAGDFGTFITAAEWLDVNYGALARALFAGPLGLQRLDVIAPAVQVFADVQTTSVIMCFDVGSKRREVTVRYLTTTDALEHGLRGGKRISRTKLAGARRWGPLVRSPRAGLGAGPPTTPKVSKHMIELGELCRVHRGQVTGANRVWIQGDGTPDLPERFLHPAITRAKELFGAGARLRDGSGLRRIIDLPQDLDALDARDRELIDLFLCWARTRRADRSYIARHRSPWWSVKLRAPAPILATYMARRPPAFVRNPAKVRHINIAHGIYPREPMSAARLDALARFLNGNVSTDDGRTYAGGLTKFEPKEMERLLVPRQL